MNYLELQSKARTLDPKTEQCPVIFRKSILRNAVDDQHIYLVEKMFGTSDCLAISRDDLLRWPANKEQEKFLLSVLGWGFPTNLHGLISRAIKSWQALLEFDNFIRSHHNITETEFAALIPDMKAIKGVGISTYSKILYFRQSTIAGNSPAIIDKFVAKGICNLQGEQFASLKAYTRNDKWRNFKKYPCYLQEMNKFSKELGVSVDQLEYALFLTGKKNL